MRSERTLFSLIKRHQIVLVSVFLSLFSLHLALTDRKQMERGYVVRTVIGVVVTPVQGAILGVYNACADTWNDYVSLVGVGEENLALKAEITRLRQKNTELTEELALARRLKTLLDYKSRSGLATVAAEVRGFNIERWTRTIVINKGSDDGVTKDMSVITPEGVVGRVIETTPGTSRVLLTTDLRSNIDVFIQRTRTKGILEGNGGGGLRLKYVRELDDVQVGDRLVTSGFAGIYPKGLEVGVVTETEKGGDNFFKKIEVEPAVDIDNLESALVVVGEDRGGRP